MTVTAPHRPPRLGDPADLEALEALIEEARRRARRRRRWYGAGVLLAAAAAAGAFFGFGNGGGGGNATEEAPSRGARAASEQASWRKLPPAPIVGRTVAGAVWTGTEMLIWGGLDDGDGNYGPNERSDGAAYNPATRTWRKLAPPPPGVLGGPVTAAVWTGKAALFWVARWPDDPSGGAYYPQTDSWRPLKVGPFPSAQGYPSAWTGKELIVIRSAVRHPASQARGGPFVAAALDPKKLSWRPLRALNRLRDPPNAHEAVWNGSEVFLLGDRYPCREVSPNCRPIFIAYDPATDAVRRISIAKAPIPGFALWGPFASTATDVLFRSRRNWRAGFIRYSPATDNWRRGKPPPCAPARTGYSQDAWLGDRYVAACGRKGLQIYIPVTDSWRTIRPGPSPVNSRSGSAIVWSGTELIVWSGTVYKRFNPKPADGVSLRLRE